MSSVIISCHRRSGLPRCRWLFTMVIDPHFEQIELLSALQRDLHGPACQRRVVICLACLGKTRDLVDPGTRQRGFDILDEQVLNLRGRVIAQSDPLPRCIAWRLRESTGVGCRSPHGARVQLPARGVEQWALPGPVARGLRNDVCAAVGERAPEGQAASNSSRPSSCALKSWLSKRGETGFTGSALRASPICPGDPGWTRYRRPQNR